MTSVMSSIEHFVPMRGVHFLFNRSRMLMFCVCVVPLACLTTQDTNRNTICLNMFHTCTTLFCGQHIRVCRICTNVLFCQKFFPTLVLSPNSNQFLDLSWFLWLFLILKVVKIIIFCRKQLLYFHNNHHELWPQRSICQILIVELFKFCNKPKTKILFLVYLISMQIQNNLLHIR